MVNKARYQREMKHLKGVAKEIMRKRLERINPEFMRIQMDMTVEEDEQIKQPHFDTGDRVQITKGKDKGIIGKIVAMHKQGNSAVVDNASETMKMILPKAMWVEGQNKPLIEMPKPVPYENLRLVSQVKNSNGTVEDVAVHSMEFKGSYYDSDRNKIMPIRRSKHDHSITIPWPIPSEPLKETESSLATSKDAVEERTYFPDTIVKGPVKAAAMNQIRNPYSSWNKHKKVRGITTEEADLFTPPEMPLSPATKELFNQLQNMPQKPAVEFTEEIESFINQQVEQGLQNRLKEETEALKDYE